MWLFLKCVLSVTHDSGSGARLPLPGSNDSIIVVDTGLSESGVAWPEDEEGRRERSDDDVSEGGYEGDGLLRVRCS